MLRRQGVKTGVSLGKGRLPQDVEASTLLVESSCLMCTWPRHSVYPPVGRYVEREGVTGLRAARPVRARTDATRALTCSATEHTLPVFFLSQRTVQELQQRAQEAEQTMEKTLQLEQQLQTRD